MKNHAKLPCQRDARLANPGPLRNSLRPILQTRRLLDPRQDHDSRLVHQCADKRIARSRNPAATVDLPRLILPWCQPHVRADRPRSGKAGRVLDRTDTGQHSDDPDTGHAHQQPARRVLLRQRAHRFIEDRNLFAQLSPCCQHGSDDRRQVITLGEQSLDPSVERKASHCTRQHSKRLEHAPDMVRRRVVMLTSCALAPSSACVRWASSDFTCTDRYHPVRMLCASPSASFRSVLFICILSAALACLASRQTMLSPRSRSSCTSHGVIGPVSIPMPASSPACPRTARSICSGSVRHWPRQSLRPASSTTQIEVSFCETSKPTNRVIEQSPLCEPPGNSARTTALWSAQAPSRDYPMSTYGLRTPSRCRVSHAPGLPDFRCETAFRAARCRGRAGPDGQWGLASIRS